MSQSRADRIEAALRRLLPVAESVVRAYRQLVPDDLLGAAAAISEAYRALEASDASRGSESTRTEYRVRHVDLRVGGYPIDRLTTDYDEALAEARALREIESVTEVWVEKREMSPWLPVQQTEFPRPKEMGHGW